MSTKQPIDITSFQWQQPVGSWRQRGANSAALRVGLGLSCPAGASNEKDNEGFGLWHYWANSPRPHESFSQLIKCLGRAGVDDLSEDGIHPWHYLIHRGHLVALKKWIDRLGQPQEPAPSKQGDTFAHAAAWSANPEIVKLLSKKGFEHIDTPDDKGVIPLVIAVHRGGVPLIDSFLMSGANPDHADLEGRSAMHHAALHGDIELTSLLEDAGGDMSIPDSSGLSAASILRTRKSLSEGERDGIRAHWEKRSTERLIF